MKSWKGSFRNVYIFNLPWISLVGHLVDVLVNVVALERSAARLGAFEAAADRFWIFYFYSFFSLNNTVCYTIVQEFDKPVKRFVS